MAVALYLTIFVLRTFCSLLEHEFPQISAWLASKDAVDVPGVVLDAVINLAPTITPLSPVMPFTDVSLWLILLILSAISVLGTS